MRSSVVVLAFFVLVGSLGAQDAIVKTGFFIGPSVPEFLNAKNIFTFDLVSGYNYISQNVKKLEFKRVDGILDLSPYTIPWEAEIDSFIKNGK